MDTLIQDLRYAIRLCVHAPAFTAIAVLALALGIGANTAIFTIVNAALIERLPFKDPSRLVILWEENSRRPGRSNTVGPSNYLSWRERADVFEDMSGFVDTRTVLTGDGEPEELTQQVAMGPLLSVLGVRPLLGRAFNEAEIADGSINATVLSYELWMRRFGGDPSIVGRTIHLNGNATTVVGVMPPDMRLLMRTNSLVRKPSDLWVNYSFPASARTPRGRYMSVIARLKPGVSIEQARAQMNTIAAGLTAEFPDFDTGWKVRVIPLREELSGELKPALLVLSGAVAFVLLIACANVANLLLARGAARQREIAIRGALGAPRGRVIKQLLTESLVLGALGGVLGLIVARWSLDGMIALSPVDLTPLGHITISYPVLAFTAVVSIVTAVICGLAPAFEGARIDVHESLKDGSRQAGASVRHRRLRQAFVVSEVALAVVLLVGAGLMLRSFQTLRRVNPGFDTRNILTARVALPGRTYDTPQKALQFFREASQKIAALPGVRSAGMISFLPFTTLGAATDFSIAGQPPRERGKELVTTVSVCDNAYFAAVRLPLVRGRLFAEREMRERSNVVIVNETFTQRYFPGGDPIGQRVVIDMLDINVPTEIVGVVGSSKFLDLRGEPPPAAYWPHPQLAYNAMTLTIRTTGDPASIAPAVERAVHTIDKDQPLSDVRTLDQWLARTLAPERFNSLLLGVFAAVALALASLGIYGVISYSVTLRTSEIGVRVALGAQRRDILRLVVGTGMRLAVVGLAIGVVLALALTRTVTSLLYQTTTTDPMTFASVVGVLAVVAALASYLPARRASRIAPVEALRYQ